VALLNQPIDKEEYGYTTYYVHGEKQQFKEMLNIESLKKKNYIMDIPLFKKLPSDAYVRHTRNTNIKDDLMFDMLKGKEMKTFCIRMYIPDPKQRVIAPKL
jgi:hypothetical protein